MQLLRSAEEFNDDGIIAHSVDPVKKFNEDLKPEERKQNRNADDVLLWDVACTVTEGSRIHRFKVRLARGEVPEVSPGVIRFGGLEASTYEDGPRNIVTFKADTFTQDGPPSAKRSAKTVAPPVPAS